MNKRVGRPVGSGTQLPAAERLKKSRSNRMAKGAMRLDVTLDATRGDQLLQIMQQWQCATKKEAIERALDVVFAPIEGK